MAFDQLRQFHDVSDRLLMAEERIRQLEDILNQHNDIGPALGLTRKESQILGVILARPVASVPAIYTVVYGGDYGREMPDERIIRVFMNKIRGKLREGLGVEIECVWGQGYRMSESDKRTVLDFVEAKQPIPRKVSHAISPHF